MNNLPANWRPPETPRNRSSQLIPAVITIFCLLILTGGSIFGFLATCSYEHRSPLNGFFAGATIFLIVALALAFIWFVLAFVFSFFGAGKDPE